MGLFTALFGKKVKVNFGELIQNGAFIIDVRTSGEYQTGHLKGSKNIPLDKLMSQVSKIKKDQVIITCCASGMRSASAKGMLKNAGFSNVHNGGSWSSLNKYM
jgi:phage shock protein E